MTACPSRSRSRSSGSGVRPRPSTIPRPTAASSARSPTATATTMVPTALTNPAFKAFATFSSGGPRTGDSGLKPDITGPGVSIVSTGVGTGNRAATISGTSMASPHVAGVAALTRQAHPSWTVEDIKGAIVNTGNPAEVVGYRTSRGGTGLVQPQKSARDAGRGEGGRRSIRRLGELRLRGAADQLQRDAPDHVEEQQRRAGELHCRSDECHYGLAAFGRPRRAECDRARKRHSHRLAAAERARSDGRELERRSRVPRGGWA